MYTTRTSPVTVLHSIIDRFTFLTNDNSSKKQFHP